MVQGLILLKCVRLALTWRLYAEFGLTMEVQLAQRLTIRFILNALFLQQLFLKQQNWQILFCR